MDLHLHTNLFYVKFADDSSFEATGTSREVVEFIANEELKKVGDWFTKNRLTLHPDKSRYMVCSRDKLIRLHLNGIKIQRCQGVKIVEKLDWKEHIKDVAKKISKGNYLLWRHKTKLNSSTKKLIYESFVRSHILFCITVWGGAKQGTLTPLNRILKRIWKKVGSHRQHTLTNLKSLEILKLEDKLFVQECKLIWKWEKGKVPPGLKQLLEEKQDRLRARRFNRYRNSGQGSINHQLATRA